MSDTTVILTQSFRVMLCSACHIAYAVPVAFEAENRRTGKTFYCPNGHSQAYTESENTRLKRELEAIGRALQQARNREEALAADLRRTEIAKKKMAKRLSAGVCPVPNCKRHFTNLQRHIETEHKGESIPALGKNQVKQIGYGK
jgi:predicted  nucleic acid-binding Zn-ribbon protein